MTIRITAGLTPAFTRSSRHFRYVPGPLAADRDGDADLSRRSRGDAVARRDPRG
ncbi:hypothetical protein, partial [Halorubrum laminariae]